MSQNRHEGEPTEGLGEYVEEQLNYASDTGAYAAENVELQRAMDEVAALEHERSGILTARRYRPRAGRRPLTRGRSAPGERCLVRRGCAGLADGLRPCRTPERGPRTGDGGP